MLHFIRICVLTLALFPANAHSITAKAMQQYQTVCTRHVPEDSADGCEIHPTKFQFGIGYSNDFKSMLDGTNVSTYFYSKGVVYNHVRNVHRFRCRDSDGAQCYAELAADSSHIRIVYRDVIFTYLKTAKTVKDSK